MSDNLTHQMSTIRTRFAPSPTGMLHIGGARTALFNYLFAKHSGGQFLLRIEDTDVARSTTQAKDAIIDGMKWLGLNWDGDIVYQMSRQNRHVEVVKMLIEKGAAYYAFDNVDEIAKEREECSKNGKIYRYNSKWRDGKLTPPEGMKPTIRLKIPNGITKWTDLVKGEIAFNNDEIEDFVLLRSDGVPTYMLAVVVDDIDMQITHVIRGDDHVSNTPKQILIYNAIGAKLPEFGHIPLIYDISGQKLSKRRGAVAVGDYADMGYLPEAVCSYLMQLGWSSKVIGDKIVDVGEAIECFNINELGSSPSKFDFEKLNFINLQYLQGKSDTEILDIVKKYLSLSVIEEERIIKIASEIKKSHTITEVVNLARLFTDNPPEKEEDARQLIESNPDVVEKLKEFVHSLKSPLDFKEKFDALLKENNWKFGFAGPILRSMLIGKKSSLSVGAIINAFGNNIENRLR